MRGLIRDLLCGPALWGGLLKWKKTIEPRRVPYGRDKAQYFLDFVPHVPHGDTVVVYIHGGGWDKGSPAFFSFIGEWFAREGYRCVMPGYRLVPKHPFPAQLQDVTAGTRAALAYLEGRGVDTDRVVVVGSSAGGQLGRCCAIPEPWPGGSPDLSVWAGLIGSIWTPPCPCGSL